MEAATSRARASSHPRHEPEAEHLTDYCSYPKCRKEFRRAAGPGRRQAFCSEMCRRTAQNELRRARARLAHYEALVLKLRIDVEAFGKPDSGEDSDTDPPLSLDARQQAGGAVLRAEGVLKFAKPDDPVWQELRRLYEAVAPIVRSDMLAS
jgi:hypothetical protein